MRGWFLALLLITTGNAHSADPVTLTCTGKQYIFHHGDWSGGKGGHMQTELLVHISPSRDSLRVEGLLYLPSLMMSTTAREYGYLSEAVIGRQIHGQFISRVLSHIKRTTGQIRITAHSVPQGQPQTAFWMMYSGVCEPLQAKF